MHGRCAGGRRFTARCAIGTRGRRRRADVPRGCHGVAPAKRPAHRGSGADGGSPARLPAGAGHVVGPAQRRPWRRLRRVAAVRLLGAVGGPRSLNIRWRPACPRAVSSWVEHGYVHLRSSGNLMRGGFSRWKCRSVSKVLARLARPHNGKTTPLHAVIEGETMPELCGWKRPHLLRAKPPMSGLYC